MTQNPENNSEENEPKKGWGIIFILIGLILLAGSIYTIINKEWPIFLTPIQLDGLHAILKILGEKAEIYFGSLLLLVFGVGSCWLGFSILKHEKDA